ncbi:6-phosphogluconolactonase [Actinomadura kijaniata]|uniref:6-phosphogluconolactonase n=1 Tax=Actinomadura namibiensis TaxID=182080 RepID=A0A7W3LVY8_ACTNM|nr:6-phosphogluconolactonase [Actinomadura namibiensis]MBA8955232.1 6-phosphogluconolactonase [Actinomadura namibiensis]
MSTPVVVVHADQQSLAEAVAAKLVTRIAEAQAQRGSASIVVTGGGVGTAVLAALNGARNRGSVDWRRLDVWWGDERFLPAGDPERNETGARQALLDHVDLDPSRVHAMPATDGPDGDDAEAAAGRYAAELAAAARAEGADGGAGLPTFDVLMLGVGPDAHVASLFPKMFDPSEERTVVPVHDSPKPPPTRISLTMSAIRTAREVWILAAGESKAQAVGLGLSPAADPLEAPVAGARGAEQTLFLLDAAAAGGLPPGVAGSDAP